MSLPSMPILREFPNPYYVETGVYRGDSIQQALDAGCFKNIVGLEIDYEMVMFCRNRFDLYQRQRPELRLYECDTASELGDQVKHIPESITFLLDAHWQMHAGTDPGKNPFPLMKELEQIADVRKGKDTIIIDDFLYLTHPQVTGWSKDDVINAIRKINKKYAVRLTSNPIVGNLLIAVP